MKRSVVLYAVVLLLMDCILPPLGYWLGHILFDFPTVSSASSEAIAASSENDADNSALDKLSDFLFGSSEASSSQVTEFLVQDQSSGEVLTVSVRDYLIGAVAAEMPISWPDEALKAQAVAAHSYVLYRKDHPANGVTDGAWLTADPARRQGFLTNTVLRSYWGTDYEQNYARLSALVDEVLNEVLYYDGAPIAASYFAISNGFTEASENVWDTALPYLRSVDSSTDLFADNYTYTVVFTTTQLQAALTSFSLDWNAYTPESYFGAVTHTDAGYVASIEVCGTTIKGTTLRSALSLRSACFSVQYADGTFQITTRGYGHGVGLSQWGAKALAEQGQTHAEILAHYFPSSVLGVG
jgi:stage II sporulation protein D